jgi:hypothetical protein
MYVARACRSSEHVQLCQVPRLHMRLGQRRP